MKTLLMTIGLPQSGKSTWARSLGHPIVCPDSIRLALHGQPFVSNAEPFVWAIAKTMVRSLFLAGHDTVILDACNTSRKRRDDWISKEGIWRRQFQTILTNLDVCIERAEKTGTTPEHRDGLVGAIKRMHENWESLEREELDQ